MASKWKTWEHVKRGDLVILGQDLYNAEDSDAADPFLEKGTALIFKEGRVCISATDLRAYEFSPSTVLFWNGEAGYTVSARFSDGFMYGKRVSR